MIKFYYFYLKVFRHFLCYHNIDNMDNEKMPKNAERCLEMPKDACRVKFSVGNILNVRNEPPTSGIIGTFPRRH